MGLWMTEPRGTEIQKWREEYKYFPQRNTSKLGSRRLSVPFLTTYPGSTWTRTWTRSPHSPAPCTAPLLSSAQTLFPLFSRFKSYGSCEVPHGSSFERRARSSLESLQRFPPAKALSLSRSSELIKKAPQIFSSLLSADVRNSETISGFCYLYAQTLNSLKSGTVS